MMIEKMRVCDLCAAEGNTTEATVSCVFCNRDVCEDHSFRNIELDSMKEYDSCFGCLNLAIADRKE